MYAEVTDLEARWRTLTPGEKNLAEVLLQDSAVRLDSLCPPSDPATEHELSVRLIVSCEMVKRAMSSPGGVGISSTQQGAGPYQQTIQYANPTGDIYLTKADKALLGCGTQAAFTVPMGAPVADDIDWWITP